MESEPEADPIDRRPDERVPDQSEVASVPSLDEDGLDGSEVIVEGDAEARDPKESRIGGRMVGGGVDDRG